MTLTLETNFSLHKINHTQPDSVSITSKAHHSTLFSHVITILPASVMGRYFERPKCDNNSSEFHLSIEKQKNKKKKFIPSPYVIKLNNLTFSDSRIYHGSIN